VFPLDETINTKINGVQIYSTVFPEESESLVSQQVPQLHKMLLSLLFALCLLASSLHGHVYDRGVHNQHVWKKINFISTVLPKKGEQDIRVASDGLLAMEVVIPKLKENGIFYREVTNGKTFLQLVYQNRDVLIDCDMTRDPDSVEDFIRRFFKLDPQEDWREMHPEEIIDRIQHGQNITFTKFTRGQQLPDEAREMVEFEMMKYECKNLHREQRNMLKSANEIQNLDSAKAFNDEEDTRQSSRLSGGYNRDSETQSKSRTKRSMFIYPGTNWCGKGSTASNYYDLGENIDTDKCCRAHDYCSVTIEGLSSNYNYFNYRLHTLSHCECDDQFHTCLKTSGDDVSEMVGNLFFNVIGNKCFVLKQTKVCMKRSWWGKCDKWKKQSQAELREPLEY